jgi:dinuclear metal center YbgI/SA1388 family protein
MEELAPAELTQSWDNTGLMLGDAEQEVYTVLVALDVTGDVINEAINNKADMIITHHPLIFKPLYNIRKGTPIGDKIHKLIQNNISVFSAHTNLDMVDGGVNDILALQLGLIDIKTLKPIETEKLKKIVVFVPVEYADKVREAMAEAGAGHIGNYSDCSFIMRGLGTFKPLEGSDPFVGQIGNLENVEECRIETIVTEKFLKKVIKAMIEAHPYEEAAYDVYSVENTTKEYGFAKVGKLEKEMSVSEFSEKLKLALNTSFVKMVGNPEKKIRTVAVSSGAYSEITQMAKAKKVDVIVTGDLKYHDAQDILECEMCAIDAGHFATEDIIVSVIVNHISKIDENINVIKSTKSKDVLQLYFHQS